MKNPKASDSLSAPLRTFRPSRVGLAVRALRTGVLSFSKFFKRTTFCCVICVYNSESAAKK